MDGITGIRRIYFSDRLYSEEELPPEFKLFLPVPCQTRTLGATGCFGLGPNMLKLKKTGKFEEFEQNEQSTYSAFFW